VSDQSKQSGSIDPRVEAALREYLERIDRGEPVKPEDFLSQHAEIADALRSFITAEVELRKLAGAQSPPESDELATGLFAAHGQETLPPGPERGAEPARAGLQGQLGRYRIIRALGSGAMGIVYLAEDTQLQRQVAIKTPHFEDDPTGEMLDRFYREARTAATLRHANICPVYDVGEIDGKRYISMAYIEGRPLAALIRADKPQTQRQILLAIHKLAQAIQHAHDHGIVHRDLKPSNIMVDKKGEPIIMDFGLARQIRRDDDIRLTKSGMLIGTPAFMSPEQVEGEPERIGPATDQYSLGVILYELLTGRLPFVGSVTAVMGQILFKEPPPPSQLRPDLDLRIEAVCLKMMAKNSTDRFPSLSAVASDVAKILKNPAAKAASEEQVEAPTPNPATKAPADLRRREADASQILERLQQQALTEDLLKSRQHRARDGAEQHHSGIGSGTAARREPLAQFRRRNQGIWLAWSVVAVGMVIIGVMFVVFGAPKLDNAISSSPPDSSSASSEKPDNKPLTAKGAENAAKQAQLAKTTGAEPKRPDLLLAPKKADGQRPPTPPIDGKTHAASATASHKLAADQPARPNSELHRPLPRPEATLKNVALEDPEKGIALPGIGGWVMLPDGVTLIVALPDRAQLVYIDTRANQEMKRVSLKFRPNLLAAQGKRLFVSVQGACRVNILDLPSGTFRKPIDVPGEAVMEMACHPKKGMLYVSATPRAGSGARGYLSVIDPISATVAPAGDLATARPEKRVERQSNGSVQNYDVTAIQNVRGQMHLVLDAKTAGTLYVARHVMFGAEEVKQRLGLAQYAIAGKIEYNQVPPSWSDHLPADGVNQDLLPVGPFWPLEQTGDVAWATTPTREPFFGTLHVSSDGKKVALLGGGGQICLYSTQDFTSRAGTIECPGVSDFVFHPVLDLIAAEGSNIVSGVNRGLALFLFDSKSLRQVAIIALGRGAVTDPTHSARLLTFGSRGTSLLHYDWLHGGSLRSFPLTLPSADREALAKAYRADVPAFQVPDAIEGENMKILASSPGFSIGPQDMTTVRVGRWSGDKQLFARARKSGAWAELELPATSDGKYRIVAYLARSSDYGIVQFTVNGTRIGTPIDGFADSVKTTGAIDLGEAALKKGPNTLRVEVVGTNPDSRPPRYAFGLDCVVLKRSP
jgi:serine/threonine protein kinase